MCSDRQKEDAIGLYAYKNNRDIKKLKSHIDVYHKQKEMQKLGLSAGQLSSVLSSAPIEETYIYKDNSRNRVILAFFFAGLMLMAVF